GVRRLQPGIESLSTGVLKLMRKGTTSIQNVRLLKWAKYYDISISWNVLSGFPGEQPEDYAQQMEVMRLIPHLEPPTGCTRIWLERYSPNFTEAEERGIINVRPDRSYACIYPGGIDLERIAYFFEYDAPTTLTAEAHEPLRDHIRAWRERWESTRRPYLGYLRGAGRLTVLDGRRAGEPRVHTFEESAALAYEFCGPTYHRMPQVLAHLQDDCGIETNPAAVQRHLEEFTERGLMLEEDGQYLSLALPANANW
ncbi:MAG: RiPP maturation radical SAM C-methyltransferase, partial [Dehalococcoidia bacterium]